MFAHHSTHSFCRKSGSYIPLPASPNLAVLKHPCVLGAKQKPNVANAKLINRGPAAWALERLSMPGRKYFPHSVRVCCDNGGLCQ